MRDVTPLMGVPQPFQILKMDRRRGNIVVSRRTVLEESRAEQRHEIVANLEEGQVIDGTVKNITDYGAFVDLGGIDGLLHVTDIAWRRVNHPTEVLTIGQTVKVKIIKINHETHRISLGMKQLLDDPWQGIEAKYPIELKLSGRVTNITDYGAFVELEPGIEGLIHVSEMSWTKKNVHPGKIVATSQEVEVQVLEVDPVKRRISLGLKQTLSNPWEKAEIREKAEPRGRDVAPVLVEGDVGAADEGVGDGDPESTRQMVVAGSGKVHARVVRRAGLETSRYLEGCHDPDALQHLRHERRPDPVIAMPTLRARGQEPRPDELRQVTAGGRFRHPPRSRPVRRR